MVRPWRPDSVIAEVHRCCPAGGCPRGPCRSATQWRKAAGGSVHEVSSILCRLFAHNGAAEGRRPGASLHQRARAVVATFQWLAGELRLAS